MRPRRAQIRSESLFSLDQSSKSPLVWVFSLFPFLQRLKGTHFSVDPEIMTPAAGKSTKPMCYKLYGVLYHHDEPVGGRGYTVDVLQQNGESRDGEAWSHIDGEAMSAVRHEDVFVNGGQENERVDDGCVYMLFYSRTDPAKA